MNAHAVNSMPDPRWRGEGTAPAAPSGPLPPLWRQTPGSVRYRMRWRRLILAGLGFVTFVGLLIWVVLWISPPEPARLVLVESGYEDNLAIPHNVAGRKSSRALAEFARHGSGSWFRGRGRLRFDGEPIELKRAAPQAWQKALDNRRNGTIVVYLTLHGGADPDGAYLLPNDAEADPSHRVRIETIIDHLAQLAPTRKKLLILDATQVPANAPFGMLHNDFARALAALEPRIAAVPNLAVFSSSDIDQRSWTSPELGMTAFGHYLVQGMKGAADANRDRHLDATELVQFVRDRVGEFARDQRGSTQTPVLLPLGEEGERRIAAMHLTLLSPQPRIPPIMAAPTPFDPPPELDAQWSRFRELARNPPHPAAYAPHLWREYQHALLRYEELLSADAGETTDRMRARVNDLANRLEASRRIDLGPLTQTFALPALGGFSPNVETSAAKDAIARLSEATDAELPKVWEKARTTIAPLSTSRERLELCAELLRRAGDDPVHLARLVRLIPLVTDGFPVRPAELHLLAMLSRDAPPVTDPTAAAPPLADALRLRQKAEEAALGQRERIYPYAETTFPWLQAALAHGDAARRVGEDLLFPSETRAWNESRRALLGADEHYDEALANADSVREALRIRNRALTELPGLADWLAARAHPSDLAGRMTRERYVASVIVLWSRVLVLNRMVNDSWSSGDKSGDLAALRRIASEVETALSQLRESYLTSLKALLAAGIDCEAPGQSRADAIEWLHAANALAGTPLPEDAQSDLRSRLLRERRRVSRQLLVLATTRPETQKQPSADQLRESAFDTARRRGQLALASLGQSDYSKLVSKSTADAFEVVRHRIDHFAGEADGRHSLALAGASIGRSRLALNGAVNAGSEATEISSLAEADRLSRLLDGTTNSLLRRNPGDAYRRACVQRILVAQARRTLADHWYAEGATPYYRTAGLYLLTAGRRVRVAVIPDMEPLANLLRSEEIFPLSPSSPRQIVLTSEREVESIFALNAQAGQSGRPGAVTFWTDGVAENGKVMTPSPRTARSLDGREPAKEIRRSVDNPYFLEKNQPDVPRKETATLRLNGLFRGRKLQVSVPVEWHALPQAVAWQSEPAKFASIALRTSPEIQDRYGAGSGSIAIVLDCSGSMAADPSVPMSRGRLAEAIDALQCVLQNLPPGCRLEIWAFGQRAPNREARTPEETIEQVVEPLAWKGAASGQLDPILQRLRLLQPWERSPIARAIVQAKRSLDQAPPGFKTILALTDGVDNRFAEDEAFNRERRSIPEALRTEFAGSGIALNVVAFQLSDQDERRTQAQFRVVEQLRPPGKFLTPRDADRLANDLRDALRQRIRYRLRPARSGDAELPLPGTDVTVGAGSDDLWYPLPLEPGEYDILIDADRHLTQRIRLNAGDRLLARLSDRDGGFHLDRVFTAAEAKAVARVPRRPETWTLAALQNQLLDGGRVQLLLAIEDNPRHVQVLEPSRIGEAWIELGAPAKANPFCTRWGREPGYPAPSWSVESPRWPTVPGGAGPAQPTASAWWQPSLFPGELLERPTTSLRLSEPLEKTLDGRKITVESVRLEKHVVQSRLSPSAERDCIVVRLAHPPGEPVWARLFGLTSDGHEHRFYREANRVTCLFWRAGTPFTAEEVDASLVGLELVSVGAFKRDAEQNGRHHKLTAMPVPDAAYIRPPLPIPVR